MQRRRTHHLGRYGTSALGNSGLNQLKSEPFIPQYGISLKEHQSSKPDSLQKFQWELQSYLKVEKNQLAKERKRQRVNTESFRAQNALLQSNSKQIDQLKSEIRELKGSIQSENKFNYVQDRLDRVLIELARSKQQERSNKIRSRQSERTKETSVPAPFYPMYNMYPPYPPYPPYNHYNQEPSFTKKKSYDHESEIRQPKKPKNRYKMMDQVRRKLRKYFFVVAFTVFIKKEAKKLSTVRKNNMRKFYLQKFEGQIQHAKNWLVDSHAYCISVILQKKKHSINFQKQKNDKIKAQKQNLILKLIMIGCQKMKADCTPQKISLFSQLIYNLCRRGSYCMSRFWTAHEMESICISQNYGFLRVDNSLQKFLIGVVIFMKLLIFNMLLQPHKFDSENFPKDQQPLKDNMYIISSVYYRIVKQVLEEYLGEDRSQYYELGNWLNVKAEYIVECCEPLVFNCQYPDSGQFISGLILSEQMDYMQQQPQWDKIKMKIKGIIEFFHKQMVSKGALIRKNMKYKLYK